jgi:hypothetical protein
MTNKEKNKSVDHILTQGLVKPLTFWQRISEMFRVLGLRFVFWDLNYSLIFIAVTLFGFILFFRHAPVDYQYSVAVGISPMLFLVVTLFAETSVRACGLFELKQTCRYTSRQITALRCIFYSVAGAAFAVTVAAIYTEGVMQFFRLLTLCLGGMFLCAAIELSIIRLTRQKWFIVIFPCLWVLANIALPFIFREKWELFLSGLPIVFTIVLAVSSAAVFIYQTKKMLTEEISYVIA